MVETKLSWFRGESIQMFVTRSRPALGRLFFLIRERQWGMLRLSFATPDDLPLVLSFIGKLAEYERLTDKVVATENLLQTALFGERPSAEVILARLDDAPVGFALFFHTFSTFLGRPGSVPRGPLRRRGASRQGNRQGAAGGTGGDRARTRVRAAASGRCSTGIRRRSSSIRAWARNR